MLLCTQGIKVGGGAQVDTVGHGTNVAGCAMSNTYGSAIGEEMLLQLLLIEMEDQILREFKTLLAHMHEYLCLVNNFRYVIAGFQWVQRNHKRNKSVAK